MFTNIFIPSFLLVCSYWILCSGLGLLARCFDIKVNYTRKIGHFSMFIFPGVIYYLFNVSNPADKIIVASFSSMFFFVSLIGFFAINLNIFRCLFSRLIARKIGLIP
ncbi:hypothetical protein SODG_004851 [Sodalis praecaptivus]|nr:hypothetical protein NVIRENTERO_03574 [Sodalis praecaptivus]